MEEIPIKEEILSQKRSFIAEVNENIESAEQGYTKKKRRSNRNKTIEAKKTNKATGSGRRKSAHPKKAASKIEPHNSKDIRFTLEIGEKKINTENTGEIYDFFGYITSKGEHFVKGNQNGKRHDEGDSYGYFESYDNYNEGGTANTRRIHILLPRKYEESDERYSVM